MRKKKILYVISSLENGGMTKQLCGIVEGLDKEEFEALVLTLSPEPEDSLLPVFLEKGIKVFCLNKSRIAFTFNGKKYVENKILSINPDVIHTHGVRADYAVSGLKHHEKIHCSTLHNYVWEDSPKGFGKLKNYIYIRMQVYAIKKCKYNICCSESIKKMYEKKLHRRMRCIQNGVNLNHHVPRENGKKARTIYVMACSLIERKSPLIVVQAFQELENIINNAELWVLGDGPLLAECKRYESDYVKMYGKVDDVYPYFAQADYFISASKSEGLPTAVLEAGSEGASFILSDIPQHRECVRGLEENVYFFDVGNKQNLKKRLLESKEKADDIAHNKIMDFFKDKFSTKNMSIQYQQTYNEISSKV